MVSMKKYSICPDQKVSCPRKGRNSSPYLAGKCGLDFCRPGKSAEDASCMGEGTGMACATKKPWIDVNI